MKTFLSTLFLFTLTYVSLNAQTKTSLNFNISPKEFDSTVKFSFYVTNNEGSDVSLIIFNRWGTKVANVLSSKHFSTGLHDTICNLSYLRTNKYIAILDIVDKKESKQEKANLNKHYQELLTRKHY